MTAYLYIIKMKLLTSLAYRFEVFSLVFTNFILMFSGVFIWKAAYSGTSGTVDGVSEKQMVTYIVLSFLLSSIFANDVDNQINYKVRDGSIVADFIRPLNPVFSWFMEDVGQSFSALLLQFAPLLIIATAIFHFSLPASPAVAILFIISCILSYTILWLISGITGLLAFWIVELGNMAIVKNVIISILSGSMVPLWFFPESLQTIARYLPFQYTYQTPLSIYIGKTTLNEAAFSLVLQLVWIVILTAVIYAMWSRAKNKLLVQGG